MKLTLILGLLSASNVLIVLVLQWYILATIGAGVQADALFAAMALPQLFLAVLSGSLVQVLVPLLAGQNRKEAYQDGLGFLIIVAIFFSILVGVWYATAGVWVPWLVPGFTDAGKDLAISLTRIQLPGIVLNALVAVLAAIYHSRKRFIRAEFASMIANALVLLVLISVLPVHGVSAAAWAMVLGPGLQTVVLLSGLPGWRPVHFNRGAIGEAWRRIKPLLIGAGYYKTDLLLDRFLASMAPAGSLSTLYIGQQVYNAINSIVGKAITAPLVPVLAVSAVSGQWELIHRKYRAGLLATLGVTGVVFLLFLVFGRSAMQLQLGFTGITTEQLDLLWFVMAALAGTLICGAMGHVTSQTFYALGDTRTPTVQSIWSYTAYVPLKIASFHYWGLLGLAVATSAYFLTNLVLQIYSLEMRMRRHLRIANAGIAV